MREILFRGKTKRGGVNQFWIYGGIVHQTDYYGEEVDRWFIIDGTDTQDYDIGYEYEVIPESVGEYTCFTDKSGTRIFDGDILSVLDGEKGYVTFSDRGFWAFVPLKPEEFFSNPEYLNDLSLDLYCLIEESKEYDSCVVVGNIHDNPELLENSQNFS